MTWIKFHEELTKGSKRGMPRALRFILLELSLLARPLRGRVELPVGMSDRDGVVDLLGGNRREVAAALTAFTEGADPTIIFESDRGRRFLTIPSWAKWNAGAVEVPGASTERSRRFRDVQRDATTVAPPMQQRATLPRVEEIREEQSRDQIPPESALQCPENNAREERHRTLSAGGGEPEQQAGPFAAMASTDDLAAALAEQPALAALASAPHYAARLAGQLLVSGIPLALARSTIADFAVKRAHDAPDKSAEELARDLGGYFARARGKTAAARAAEPMSPPAREALEAFDAAWSKAHGGQTRAHDARDPEHAEKLVELAQEAAGRANGPDVRRVIQHKIKGYLADRDKQIMDSDHPLRLLASRFSSYGMPTGPTKPRGPRTEEAPLRAMTPAELAEHREKNPELDKWLKLAKPMARAS